MHNSPTDASTTGTNGDAFYLQLVQNVLQTGINGVAHLNLRSAEELARDYIDNPKYQDDEARVRSMIKWESSKNFSTGFIGGVGGLITLPVSIPAALSASWVLQARLAAAIARVYGHCLSHQYVRTLTLLCILGDGGKEMVKRAGIAVGKELTEQAINKISAEALLQINKQVGFKLLARAGEAGVVNLAALVPLAGGIVGGTVDAVACRSVGYTARHFFGSAEASMDIVDVEIVGELTCDVDGN